MIQLLDIVQKIKATILNKDNLDLKKVVIKNISSLEHAQKDDIAFFFDHKYYNLLQETKAKVVCLEERDSNISCIQVIHKNY